MRVLMSMQMQMEGVVYEDNYKVKYDAPDFAGHALGHQSLECIALALDIRLKSSGLTEGLVSVRTSRVSLRDLKHDLSIFFRGQNSPVRLKLNHIDLSAIHPSHHFLHLHVRITEEFLQIFDSLLQRFGLDNFCQRDTVAAGGLV